MRELLQHPYTIEIILWLLTMIFVDILADGETQKIRRIKQVCGCLVMTLMIWGITLSGLLAAAKQPPPVSHIKSPTLECPVRPVVKP
jgi:hypothetical protein